MCAHVWIGMHRYTEKHTRIPTTSTWFCFRNIFCFIGKIWRRRIKQYWTLQRWNQFCGLAIQDSGRTVQRRWKKNYFVRLGFTKLPDSTGSGSQSALKYSLTHISSPLGNKSTGHVFHIPLGGREPNPELAHCPVFRHHDPCTQWYHPTHSGMAPKLRNTPQRALQRAHGPGLESPTSSKAKATCPLL